jgi:hypothetical protein
MIGEVEKQRRDFVKIQLEDGDWGISPVDKDPNGMISKVT